MPGNVLFSGARQRQDDYIRKSIIIHVLSKYNKRFRTSGWSCRSRPWSNSTKTDNLWFGFEKVNITACNLGRSSADVYAFKCQKIL